METSPVKSKRKSALTKSTSAKSVTTKSTSTKPVSTKPAEPAFTILQKSKCPTLSQSGNIDFQITSDSNGVIHIGLTGNSGTGYFSKARQPVKEIITALEQFQAKHEITSLALKDLYTGSINSWSFLMAALLSLELVEPLKDNGRRYKLCNVEAFLASLDKLKAQHTGSGKGKPKAKIKAANRIAKSKSKPAMGK
jgi:hypothetical protein